MQAWFVSDTNFLQRLDERDMRVFRHVCPERRYPSGTPLFYAGDPATEMHVIAVGQVKLAAQTHSGKERILAVLGPEDFVGETFLGEASRHRADAVALTDTVTCPVSRAQFLQLALQAPKLLLSLAEVFSGHLAHCREQLSLAYEPVRSRIVTALLEQAQRFGTPRDDGWCDLKTGLRHEEIAAMIGATRVAVTGAFSELRREGVLSGSRGEYRLNLAALETLTEA